MVKKDGSEYRKWAKMPIEHLLPSIDNNNNNIIKNNTILLLYDKILLSLNK